MSDDFEIPERIRTDDFLIRKLSFADAELDYQAVMSSIAIIRQTRGGDWPDANLTFLDDQIDLAWHQREFEFRNSFAYTVMLPDEKECLGCFYLYPPGYRDQSSRDADADVSFWVTQTAYDSGLYPVLFNVIKNMLKSWPFQKVAYTNKILPP